MHAPAARGSLALQVLSSHSGGGSPWASLRVYNNGDHSGVVWRPDARIAGRLGFALRRKLDGREEVLTNRVGIGE